MTARPTPGDGASAAPGLRLSFVTISPIVRLGEPGDAADLLARVGLAREASARDRAQRSAAEFVRDGGLE